MSYCESPAPPQLSVIDGKQWVRIEYPCVEDLFRHINHLVSRGWHVETTLIRIKESWIGTRPVSYFADLSIPL